GAAVRDRLSALAVRRRPGGAGGGQSGPATQDDGGKPAADVCSAWGDSTMNVDVLNRSGVQSAAQSKLAIGDCDIHPRTNGYKSLYPWLSQRWQAHLQAFGVSYRQPWEKGPAFPKSQPTACRRDAWPPGGGQPGSDLAFMAAQYLDP